MTGSPSSLINLIHYDDAATASVKALRLCSRGAVDGDDGPVFLFSDGSGGESRRGIVEAAQKRMGTPQGGEVVFLKGGAGAPEERDKVYDVTRSFERLGFTPKWKGGFREFMEVGEEEEVGIS